MSALEINDLKSQIDTVPCRTAENSIGALDASSALHPSKVKVSNDSCIEEDTQTDKVHGKVSDETSNYDLIQRPRTLEAFKEQESLTEISNLKSTLNLDDLDEDDEIWIVEIPITVDPMELKNQVLNLGEKSKLKFGKDRYCAVNRDCKPNLTCVLRADDDSEIYKAVNIQTTGTMNIRRKLSGLSKKDFQFEKFIGIPDLQNIKIRHPFFGAQYDESIKKKE
ncbi:PREDICTED: uncharacterized protein LOC105361805 [Ceratosolen solmsi marchali]|uniref:Uncharacterized protein LOC105361805 n=1 Tax=Ceratosolen solmsi marchali TaxID=326594 RepID=A0AAJ7DUZ5_9HYME|nr:PREDICTED: uncharacterized protein LOC105361805 [Ceratosolen solmsi marchali]